MSAAASTGQPDASAPDTPAPDQVAPDVGAPDVGKLADTRIDERNNEPGRDEGVHTPPPYEWHPEPADDGRDQELNVGEADAEPGAPVAASDPQAQPAEAHGQETVAQAVDGAAERDIEMEAAAETTAEAATPTRIEVEEVTPAQEIKAQATNEIAAPRPIYSAGPRRPLARGTLIADRFLIVGIDAYDDEPTIYTVEDRGICPSCGARVSASEEEPFCPECGANLLSEAAGRKIFELREVVQVGDGSDDALIDGALVWHGRRFEYVKPMHIGADGDDAGEDAGRSTTFKAGVNLMVGQRSDVGRARAGRPDEDSVFALTMTGIYDSTAGPTFGLYIVCDGMGGHGDGEIASRIAARTISTYLIQTLLIPLLQGAELKPDAVTANVDAAVQLANRRVVDDSVLRSNDMGTTLTMAVVIDRDVYVTNVGDSRTYLWNEAGLNRLTEDHSVVFQMVQEGALPEEAIYTHPARSQINRSLGMPGPIEADHFHAELTPGSVLVLCCDGLWEVLRNDGIADVLMMGLNDPQTICDTMIRHANEAGGPDNISVIVVRASA